MFGGILVHAKRSYCTVNYCNEYQGLQVHIFKCCYTSPIKKFKDNASVLSWNQQFLQLFPKSPIIRFINIRMETTPYILTVSPEKPATVVLLNHLRVTTLVFSPESTID